MNRPHIVEKIQSILREVAPDSRSILYGSEARGEARPDSDIDLLIILPDNGETILSHKNENTAATIIQNPGAHKSYAERKIQITESLYDVELATGVTISPLIVLKSIWERMTTPFTLNVARDGIDL